MSVLINVDVPDIKRGVAFYTQAFGLTVRRRFGRDGVELAGWPAALFLLKKDAGTIGAGSQPRDYGRHWTPVHLDVVVEDIDAALARAVAAGAVVEHAVEAAVWGKIAMLADPFGHGLCLIQFLNRGYDEIAPPIA
ncbi:MAG: glyoxalase [Caulobacterales bacterium 32-69-10]|nr:MAG: glyoxalase [Caulobacterales bacterium 32-69-10]